MAGVRRVLSLCMLTAIVHTHPLRHMYHVHTYVLTYFAGSACTLCLQTLNASSQPTVFLDDGSNPPVYPSTGQHIIQLDIGEVVDIVLINQPANSYNGDLTWVLMPANGWQVLSMMKIHLIVLLIRLATAVTQCHVSSRAVSMAQSNTPCICNTCKCKA